MHDARLFQSGQHRAMGEPVDMMDFQAMNRAVRSNEIARGVE